MSRFSSHISYFSFTISYLPLCTYHHPLFSISHLTFPIPRFTFHISDFSLHISLFQKSFPSFLNKNKTITIKNAVALHASWQANYRRLKQKGTSTWKGYILAHSNQVEYVQGPYRLLLDEDIDEEEREEYIVVHTEQTQWNGLASRMQSW